EWGREAVEEVLFVDPPPPSGGGARGGGEAGTSSTSWPSGCHYENPLPPRSLKKGIPRKRGRGIKRSVQLDRCRDRGDLAVLLCADRRGVRLKVEVSGDLLLHVLRVGRVELDLSGERRGGVSKLRSHVEPRADVGDQALGPRQLALVEG